MSYGFKDQKPEFVIHRMNRRGIPHDRICFSEAWTELRDAAGLQIGGTTSIGALHFLL